VLRTCAALEREGFEVTRVPVTPEGLIDLEAFERALRPDTVLASVMLANNETGAIQPIAKLARLAQERGVLFHTDAVQALGKLPLDVDALGVDLLSISAHKVQGPQGVGALYLRRGVELEAQITGGGQEQGLRAGTQNVAGIVGFGAAAELAERQLRDRVPLRVAKLRDRLEEGLLARVEGARVHARAAARLPNTTSVLLPEIRGESLALELDRRGVYVSPGSACKSGSPEPSHALLALGMSPEDAHCTVRWSLLGSSTEQDVQHALACVDEILRDTWSHVRFVGCR
jgi:cysteine sulfinate desulfinase/cysteine desulfurase-like protein